jgi:four helix bundle protein
MYTYNLEKSTVWQDSKQLDIQIYMVTTKFPAVEKYGLVSQLQRAAVSIPTNISEESARHTAKDQMHFYNLAFVSLMEVLNLLIIAPALHYPDQGKYIALRTIIDKIANKLNALRNKNRYSISKEQDDRE